MSKTRKERFIEEYLIDLNAKAACIRAGYSPKSANTQGARLMRDPVVVAAINTQTKERSARTGIDADWVLKRLAKEANADLADIYRDDGSIKPIHEWPKIWRQGLVVGVESIEIRDGEGNATGEHIVKIKISDRVKRLEMIGKHISVGAFTEKVEHSGGITLQITAEDAEL